VDRLGPRNASRKPPFPLSEIDVELTCRIASQFSSQ
jgi:hypothetical protein